MVRTMAEQMTRTITQVLLERAWTRTLADGGAHRPWAWADTAPVARLTAPAHGIGQIVLAGDPESPPRRMPSRVSSRKLDFRIFASAL